MLKSLVFVLTICGFPAVLRAEIAAGRSLEWLADTSSGIGIYRTITCTPGKENSPCILTCLLEENLKGPPAGLTSFTFNPVIRDASDYYVPAPLTSGTNFLIFFRRDTFGGLQPVHKINLANPLSGGDSGLAINHKFEVLADAKLITDVVKKRIGSHPDAVQLGVDGDLIFKYNRKTKTWVLPPAAVPIPWATAAHKQIFNGSVCYLLIPVDLHKRK